MTRRTVLAWVAVTMLGASASALAHPGHDHKLLGTVTMAAPDHLMLKDREGKDHTVRVTTATKILKEKRRATMTDVQVGMRVVVTAQTENDQLVAKLIEVGPAPRPTK
jgi:hypothetical protein